MSTPPNGSAWIKRILQDFYRDLNHRSPYFDADMNKFDGDIADVDVGKHRQKVWETAGTKYLILITSIITIIIVAIKITIIIPSTITGPTSQSKEAIEYKLKQSFQRSR